MTPSAELRHGEGAASAAEVRNELERILASSLFSRSERLSRFLRFVVEETLDGNAGSLKEQVLACELYGRDAFDSAADPIVRVDARRLRDKLREYYAEHPADSVIIELPKGGYVPLFQAAPTAGVPAVQDSRPRKRANGHRRIAAIAAIAAGVALLSGALIWRLPRAGHGKFDQLVSRRLTQTGNARIAVLSPDGRRVGLVSGHPGSRGLEILGLDGLAGQVLVPPGPDHYMGVTFSPDRAEVFFVSRAADQSTGTLHAVRSTGGVPRTVMTRVDSPVSFSPDGSRIAFVREFTENRESRLMVARRDGSGEYVLHSRTLPEYVDYPAWAPDGKTIASTLANRRTRDTGLLLIRLSDGEAMPLGERLWMYLYSLSWAGDGKHLITAGRSRADGSASSIWMIDVSNGNARVLTPPVDNYYRVFAGAERLAAIQFWESKRLMVTGSAPSGEIPAGNRWRVLSSETLTGGGTGPREFTWTPDGRLITADDQLYVSTAEGVPRLQLTRGGVNDNVSACGDGRHIVYTSVNNGRTELWRIAFDGRNPVRLIAENIFGAPHCSPDGRWAAYSAVGPQGWLVLWRISIEGGSPRQLNENVAFRPAISPDGRTIAVFFAESREGQQAPLSKIAIIPAAGGPPIRTFPLAGTADRRAEPRWTPDGKGIAFVDERGAASNIWVQPLDGSPARPVSNFTSDRVVGFEWSRDGRQLAVSLGGMPHDVVLLESRAPN